MVNSQKRVASAQLKIERILVPVDFSDCSQEALAYAGSLAKIFKAKIILLHVMELLAYWLETSLTPPEDPFGLNKKLDEMVQQLVNKVKDQGIDVEGHCVIGEPYKEIIKAFEEYGADLVVMGTHGRTGLAHVVLGSTTERVISHVPGPVVAIKAENKSGLEAKKKANIDEKRRIVKELVQPGGKMTYCHLCAQPSEDIICDTCKARVRTEAFELKMKVEKEGRVDTGRK